MFLGQSGIKMAAAVLAFLPKDTTDKLLLVRVSYDRDLKIVKYADEIDPDILGSAPVIIIDGAVHSGSSMLKVCESLRQIGASNVISYTLILKRGRVSYQIILALLLMIQTGRIFSLNIFQTTA